jgi:hypothetical protein
VYSGAGLALTNHLQPPKITAYPPPLTKFTHTLYQTSSQPSEISPTYLQLQVLNSSQQQSRPITLSPKRKPNPRQARYQSLYLPPPPVRYRIQAPNMLDRNDRNDATLAKSNIHWFAVLTDKEPRCWVKGEEVIIWR